MCSVHSPQIHQCEQITEKHLLHGYPAEYRPEGLSVMGTCIELRRRLVEGLEIDLTPVPSPEMIAGHAAPYERTCVLPWWRSIANSYGEACGWAGYVLGLRQPFFHNTAVGTSDPAEDEDKSLALSRIELLETVSSRLDDARAAQDNDFVSMPIQCGLMYRAASARWVRRACAEQGQIPLDLFTMLCLLIIEPQRLSTRADTLWLLCAGTRYAHPDPAVGFLVPLLSCDAGGPSGSSRICLTWIDEDATDAQNAVPTTCV